MGRKPLLAIAGALLAGVTLSGCEAGPQYYSGQRSYMPSQGYRGGYTQGGMMYSQPQMVAGAAAANTGMAMTMKPAAVETAPAIQLASGSAPAGTTPMLTITMPAVRFQVPLTGAISYAQTTGSSTGPASVEQVPASTAAPEGPLMQAATAHTPVPAQYAPVSVPFTTPTVQSTNYATPAQPTMPAPHTAPASQAFAVPGQSAATMPMPSPAQYLPPVSPAPRADAGQLSSELPPPPVWPRTPGEGVEETTMPPVPPPIHRGPALGTTPAAPARPTLYYQ